MPMEFPHIDADGKPYTVAYFTAKESAPRLHVTQQTLRENCRRGLWPHLRIGNRFYLSERHLARIVEMLTLDPDEIGTSWGEPERRLGIVADDDTAEGGVS